MDDKHMWIMDQAYDLDEIMDIDLAVLNESAINRIAIPIEEMLIIDLPDQDPIDEQYRVIDPRLDFEWDSLTIHRYRKANPYRED